MKFVATVALCAAGALLPSLSQAQIYMCKDASGRTITSDRPIPECADRAMREYGKSGNFKRDIPPPPTAEEKRKMQEEDARKKAEESAAKERARSDNALLARYHNETDIETARKRSLANAQEQQKRESASLAKSEQQLKQAQAEIDAYNKKQAKPPVDLVRKVDDLQSGISASKKRVQEKDAEIARINESFDETLKRFRELASSASAK
jgi:chromosome segregation ATPase